jgi:eukaryotic-like serine/threonine-protein kinase
MDTTLSPPLGQLLDGRYLVESQLARGGMATVYLGKDVRLDRTVALKIAHPELARDQEFVARFISEARSVARLSSPNVVAVFDQGSTGDINYIAMEYVPGPTLRELLNSRGRLGTREALDVIEGVLTGLAAAHDAGIIHRDVKPENVLLGTGRTVKVADFGLARAAAGIRHTRTGLLIGTAAYLAPEQVTASSSDQRTDVYAVGVMLFEMLTGVQPHTGDTPLAVAYKHVNAVVPAPSSLVPELPSALDALVALGTSRDPDLRPPDARHYLQAIAGVRSGMPLSQRRGQHAAPDAEADGYGIAPGDIAAGDQGVTSQLVTPAAGNGHTTPGAYLPAPPGAGQIQHSPAQHGQPQHTMIVPADGIEPEFGGAPPDGYRGGRRRSAGYREPFLQRWLFSRRIIILAAIIVLAAGAWWLAAGRYTTVPSVTRMVVSTARGDLANAGFVVTIGAARHSNDVADGLVLTTDPSPGSRIPHGGRVTIIPSLGPKLVTVPSVSGDQLAQAEQALQSAGLKVSVTGQTSTSIQSGIVIATDPAAYQQWPADKPVTLIVSDGLPLPNFVGGQLSAAQAAAASGGYSIDAQTLASSQPANTVLKQSPAAGTPIKSGEVVEVWISQGPPLVAVPDVDGMTANQAVQVLEAAGFNVTVDDGVFGQRVTSYAPQGQAPKGSTITITIGFAL